MGHELQSDEPVAIHKRDIVAYLVMSMGFQGRPLSAKQVLLPLPHACEDRFSELANSNSWYGARSHELAENFIDSTLEVDGLVKSQTQGYVLTENGEKFMEYLLEEHDVDQRVMPYIPELVASIVELNAVYEQSQ